MRPKLKVNDLIKQQVLLENQILDVRIRWDLQVFRLLRCLFLL